MKKKRMSKKEEEKRRYMVKIAYIKYLLARNGVYSLRQLASLLGVSPSLIEHVLKGRGRSYRVEKVIKYLLKNKKLKLW